MNLLLAIDGSRYSSWAVEIVRRFPFATPPRIHLLHVVEKAVITRPWIAPPLVPSSGTEEKHALAAAKRLTRHAAAQLHGRMASIRIHIEKGPVTERIVAAAREENADLIVMGSHGLSNVQRFLMGSVSQQVVTYAPCSVLVVKQAPRPIRHVVLAVDGSRYSKRALSFLTASVRSAHLKVTVLHVRDDAAALPARSARGIKETFSQPLVHSGFTARVLFTTGHSAGKIVETVTRRRADLVVVGSRGLTGLRRFLLGSVSRQVVQHSPASVLVVRGKTPRAAIIP